MFLLILVVLAACVLAMMIVPAVFAYRSSARQDYSWIVPTVSIGGAAVLFSISWLHGYFVSQGGDIGTLMPFAMNGLPGLAAWIFGLALAFLYVNLLAALYIAPPILVLVALGMSAGHLFWRFRHRS